MLNPYESPAEIKDDPYESPAELDAPGPRGWKEFVGDAFVAFLIPLLVTLAFRFTR